MTAATPRRDFLRTVALAGTAGLAGCRDAGRLALLTFDDAVRSQRTYVAPLLAELGFSATFFVTHRWMDDSEHFMSWEEIREVHDMGFEIGNHSWSHPSFASPKVAARLEGEFALVENALDKVGVPRPSSFAWCGNHFGPEALAKLAALGYRHARRGLSPEQDDHSVVLGKAFDPALHHRLLIPTTGNSVPGWSLDFFRSVLERAAEGIVVLQFHGVPDIAHPWVHTPPELFRACMEELAEQGFRTLAMRDLEALLPEFEPDDPMALVRSASASEQANALPVEVVQTRAESNRWTQAMVRHRYSPQEAARVAGLQDGETDAYGQALEAAPELRGGQVEIWPYPGGRHPRIGFLEGAIDPLRGTKASVFLPWDPESYVVVDLPELITSSDGHQFLAHTHVPTIWNDRNVWIENVDWRLASAGGLESEWELPNGVSFGASLRPDGGGVAMGLWLRNGTGEPLAGLRTQICVLLAKARGFDAQTGGNKVFRSPVAAARSESGNRWILTAWDRAGHCWGNPPCPCVHSDPVFADCQPGRIVRLRGRLWFHEGASVEDAIRAAGPSLGGMDSLAG